MTSALAASDARGVTRGQFSLRAALTVVLVAGFLFLGAALFNRRCELADRAVDKVLSLGGTVYFDHQLVGGRLKKMLPTARPDWLPDWLPEKYVREAVYVDLQGPHITDDDLDVLSRLASLRFLNLSRTGITDEGLKKVASLSQLQHLDLDGTSISDAGLSHLTFLRHLELLKLNRTHVTERGIRGFRAAIPACRVDTGGPLVTAE